MAFKTKSTNRKQICTESGEATTVCTRLRYFSIVKKPCSLGLIFVHDTPGSPWGNRVQAYEWRVYVCARARENEDERVFERDHGRNEIVGALFWGSQLN